MQERWRTPVLAIVPFCTELECGPALLEPLTAFGSPLANLHGPISYTALQAALDEVDSHGHCYWERGDYLADLSDGAIEALVAGARTTTSKLTEILVFPMGGAIARVPHEPVGLSVPAQKGRLRPYVPDSRIKSARHWASVRGAQLAGGADLRGAIRR